MRRTSDVPWMRTATKSDLHTLIDDVKRGDAQTVSKATSFVAAETFGMWHNRARAKLCRHFKNNPPPGGECQAMVDAIIDRLISGQFSEQFKDQLSMAIRFSPTQMADAAKVAAESDKDYIRQYGKWVFHVLDSSQSDDGESNCDEKSCG